eukprot:4204232-Prymnesium_polylepis.1
MSASLHCCKWSKVACSWRLRSNVATARERSGGGWAAGVGLALEGAHGALRTDCAMADAARYLVFDKDARVLAEEVSDVAPQQPLSRLDEELTPAYEKEESSAALLLEVVRRMDQPMRMDTWVVGARAANRPAVDDVSASRESPNANPP